MRHNKKYMSEPKEYETQVSLECDICHKIVKTDEDNWKVKNSEWYYQNVVIQYIEGDKYPESHQWAGIEYHICPKCFKEKVNPFLKEIGAKPHKIENQY